MWKVSTNPDNEQLSRGILGHGHEVALTRSICLDSSPVLVADVHVRNLKCKKVNSLKHGVIARDFDAATER